MMKAKLDPKYAGILALVQRIYTKVPTPELNKAILGFIPINKGTKTVEPNIVNKCWTDRSNH